jgi:guanylate kinase
VGKGTVIAELRRRHPELGLSVSWTTRPKRAGEVDGEHYHFVTVDQFRDAIERGEFAEFETYRENLYGTPWSEVRKAVDAGRDIVIEPDVRGARSIKKLYPEAVTIFVYPPEPSELARRLRDRGTDAPEHIAERLETAKWELAQKDTFDHAVLNADVSQAVEAVEAILGFSSPERTNP